MAKSVQAQAGAESSERRFLTFVSDGRLYALPAEDVAEVIRVPLVARVPQGPKSLLGIANLRGSVLPVASLRLLLGQGDTDQAATRRAIVLDGASPIALVVDGVEALVSVGTRQIETDQAALVAETGERLSGAFPIGVAGQIARILDIQPLLLAAFAQRAKPQQRKAIASQNQEGRSNIRVEDRRLLVTFEVAGQEYGFDLEAVREILPAPANLSVVPKTDAMVLGVTAHRESVLPLLSLRGLLGFAPQAHADGREKVLVATIAGVQVGLLADRARAVLSADTDLIEPVPAALAARAGGEARIKSIYRGDGGERLVSVLAPDQLFREDVMQRLNSAKPASNVVQDDRVEAGALLQFLVFRLGEDEFALPIASVDEVARVPSAITRLPKAPKFLEGVVNLRGEVLPVVDQRRRFDLPVVEDGENRRLVVVRTERHKAGLIVDGVREVLRANADQLESPPALTDDMSRLVEAVINLESSGRIVLVLDPKELLSRAEQGLLDAFQASEAQGAP